ncbi:class I SAM-dependent RNA methyltransferase [Bifidobacterium pullorum subsp. saeculare]|uniref:Class I SAM-dependent RNA methyltransferase n=1 Tax=Bifidobacterium pullorum subsp. saeculare TaxID=78257 RepID=A0A939B7N6_9BIFI|nr:TRAM domain-containing protein [Bifidobacterium pullorum]MBM6699002.1 class I SAM-dependent RNA methyltransferase [Bifidobacterium pullorum subsp. saeculare]
MDATIRIERHADQGRCVGHIDGRVVFVRFALPGELVRVTLDEPHDREERFWTAEVGEVIEPSPDRVTPAWPLAGPLAMGGGVGGADLVHVSLPGQLAWKAATIAEQMRRLGHVDLDAAQVPVDRMDGDAALGGLHWRTRIEMIADDQGRPSMRRRGTHVRVPLDTMPLASEELLRVADAEHVWDGGFAPGSQIRLAVPEPRGGDAPARQSGDYAVLVDGKLRAGTGTLTERVEAGGADFTYRVSADGFWQMHRQAPVALVAHVLGLVMAELDGTPGPVLWDLYSGSGLFTLPLAALTGPRTRMLSVEGFAPAVANARRNLRAAGLGNVDARTGDVARTLAHVPAGLAHPDVVVLDPPRAGARAKVCRQIAGAGPRAIVYIACDPTSLARDTATLAGLGYTLAGIHAFDIYPMTHHVETIALLRRERA